MLNTGNLRALVQYCVRIFFSVQFGLGGFENLKLRDLTMKNM